jgi:hypothetical protein
MAVIASWNGRRWEVSASRIMAIEGLTTSYKLKKESNTDSEGKAASDVRGLELMPLSFTTHVSDAVGIDVRAELEAWGALVGAAAPFILGEKQLGGADFRLIQVSLADTFLDDLGRVREAKLNMQFEEYAGEAAKDKPKSGAASGGTAKTGAAVSGGLSDAAKSALGIGPAGGDKAAKKAENPQMSPAALASIAAAKREGKI